MENTHAALLTVRQPFRVVRLEYDAPAKVNEGQRERWFLELVMAFRGMLEGRTRLVRMGPLHFELWVED